MESQDQLFSVPTGSLLAFGGADELSGDYSKGHVKSTWIPAAKRRDRKSKRAARDEDAIFPAEVRLPAVFRCVKLRQMDVAEEQLAYQTAVSISGHLFRGILYDQGPDSSPSPAEHHMQLAGEFSTSAAAAAGAFSGDLATDSFSYLNQGGAFMAGTPFFSQQQPRS